MSTREQAIAELVQRYSGQLTVRGAPRTPATELLTKLATDVYERAEEAKSGTARLEVIGAAARAVRALVNSHARRAGLQSDLVLAFETFGRDIYRLMSDVYSAATGHSQGIVLDVRERAESLVASFRETIATMPAAATPPQAIAFLRELFVNALLEARETAHHVDWNDPAQVELYTIAVEAESKRYEEINLKIAAAEKAERSPFADSALQDIPAWFDEMQAHEQVYQAHNDPLFAAALNRAFALGVQAAQTKAPEA